MTHKILEIVAGGLLMLKAAQVPDRAVVFVPHSMAMIIQTKVSRDRTHLCNFVPGDP